MSYYGKSCFFLYHFFMVFIIKYYRLFDLCWIWSTIPTTPWSFRRTWRLNLDLCVKWSQRHSLICKFLIWLLNKFFFLELVSFKTHEFSLISFFRFQKLLCNFWNYSYFTKNKINMLFYNTWRFSKENGKKDNT